jgi:hypothetical protein
MVGFLFQGAMKDLGNELKPWSPDLSRSLNNSAPRFAPFQAGAIERTME